MQNIFQGVQQIPADVAQDLAEMMDDFAVGLANGDNFNPLQAIQAQRQTAVEQVQVTCTQQAYANDWGTIDAQNTIMWNTAVANYQMLRQLPLSEKESALAAMGRALLVASKLYPHDLVSNGGLPLELVFEAAIPDAAIRYTTLVIIHTQVVREYVTIKNFKAEVYLNYGRANMNRMRFVHLYQDIPAQQQFTMTLKTAVMAESASEHIMKLDNTVFRMIYHAAGFIWLYNQAQRLQYPDCIRLRLLQSPPSHALIITTSAAFRVLILSMIGVPIPTQFRDLQDQLIIAADQVREHAPRFAKQCRLYGHHIKLIHPYYAVCLEIAPMLQGFLNTLSKKSPITRQQVIRKVVGDAEIIVDQWTTAFEQLQKAMSKDINVLFNSIALKMDNFLINIPGGLMQGLGNVQQGNLAQQMQQAQLGN